MPQSSRCLDDRVDPRLFLSLKTVKYHPSLDFKDLILQLVLLIVHFLHQVGMEWKGGLAPHQYPVASSLQWNNAILDSKKHCKSLPVQRCWCP